MKTVVSTEVLDTLYLFVVIVVVVVVNVAIGKSVKRVPSCYRQRFDGFALAL